MTALISHFRHSCRHAASGYRTTIYDALLRILRFARRRRLEYPVVTTRPCWFCNRSGHAKMTTEHAHPNWVLELLPGDEKSGTTIARSSHNADRQWGSKRQTGVRVKAICEQCNTGWMSRLENDARKIMAPFMVESDKNRICRSEQLFIEFWTLKTAMVFDAVTDAPRQFFSVEERTHLATTQRLPTSKNYYVFLAKNTGPREIWADHYSFGMTMDPNGARNFVGRFYCANFVYGLLAIQLAMCRTSVPPAEIWPKLDPSKLDIHLEITGGERDQEWPPAVALDDGKLTEFQRRWILPPNPGPLNLWRPSES